MVLLLRLDLQSIRRKNSRLRHHNLGRVLYDLGNLQEALQHRVAVSQQAGFLQAHHDLGIAFTMSAKQRLRSSQLNLSIDQQNGRSREHI